MRAPFVLAAALTATSFLAFPAHAETEGGKLQVKVLGTAVLPDGKIDALNTDVVGLPGDLQTEASDAYVPTLAIEYFFSPSFSVETICCLTQHDVDAVAGLPGAELVADAKLVPATVTLKYHVNAGGISPYVGVGPAYFLWLDVDPGAATIPLGVTKTELSNELGLALQAGLDVPIGDKGFSFSLDAKRYFINTTARWYAGSTKVIETEHTLDPWVLSAGIGYRF